ncbi:MAG: TIGR03936 family radical SAM-associated protein [Anaerolineae bacterium]
MSPDENENTELTLRHRITFATRRTLAHVSVLDLGRVWERTLRRARIPLRYSQGYNPRPKMQFALPLPTGCGGDAEWLDIWLEEPWNSARITSALAGKTPEDLIVVAIEAAHEDEPALFERVLATEYRVLLRDVAPERVSKAVEAFLASESVLRPKRGRRRHKKYDLRPLVESLTLENLIPEGSGEDYQDWTTALEMRLTALPGATGRPDELLKALDLGDVPRRCTRTRIHLD